MKEQDVRHDWTVDEALGLMSRPFNDLLFDAATMHRRYFDSNKVQISQLLSIKTGGCAEDCKYCSQSSHYKTSVKAEKLMEAGEVARQARKAKEGGAERFCMGAAWREVKDRDIPKIAEIISVVKDLGMETCMTLGMLTAQQAAQLKDAGLDYYNHNVDTSPEYYGNIITTRTFDDRLETIQAVREAGISVCSGGIIGMGESQRDRASMLVSLANLPQHPGSVPINMLIPIENTPLEMQGNVSGLEFVRVIATARIMMPESYVRLSAGRENMSDELQAMCFFAGANSIFYGEKLLTADNPQENEDRKLLDSLGIQAFA